MRTTSESMPRQSAPSLSPRPARSTPFALALATVAALLILAMPAPASAIEFGLELQPGVGIPVGFFPDGVPIPFDDPQGKLLAGTASKGNFLGDFTTSPGFSFSLGFLLNNFTIRLATSVYWVTDVRISDIAFSNINGQDLPDFMRNVYLRKVLNLQGSLFDRDIGLGELGGESMTLSQNRLTLGYRWYLLDYRIRPYIPLGFGAVMMTMSGGGVTDVYWGLAFHAGVGCEYRVTPRFDIGLAFQYEWMGVFLPENFNASGATSAASTASSSGNSLMEAFLESLHTFQIGVTTTFRF